MRKLGITAALASMVICGTAFADNAMQSYEFDGGIPASDPVWVPCLNEFVYGPFHAVAKIHEFETPSGTFHLVDTWHLTQTLYGASTGRIWLNTSVAPTAGNLVKNGEIFGWTEIGLARPVNDGPKWRYNVNVKLKFDDQGNLELVIINFATGDFKCLGPAE